MKKNPLDLLQAAVRGAFCERGDGVQPTRLPPWASHQFGGDLMLESAAKHTSGVRLEVDTAATWIELRLTFTRTWFSFAPYPPRPAVMALAAGDVEHVFSFDEGDIVHVDEFDNVRRERGGSSTLLAQLGGDGTVRPVVVWLPHNCSVELLDIRADAELSPEPAVWAPLDSLRQLDQPLHGGRHTARGVADNCCPSERLGSVQHGPRRERAP